MATIQVRAVPDDVAEAVRDRAARAGQSVSAYLRDLLEREAEEERRARTRRAWLDELATTQRHLDLSAATSGDGVRAVREVRDAYDDAPPQTGR